MANFSFGRYAAPTPTSYHAALAQLLERRFPELWAQFSARDARAAAAEEMGLELARRAEPLELRRAPELYEAAGEISAAMGLEAPLTLYRAEAPAGLARNAALYFEPEHAHVVFEGDALETLRDGEIWHVVGHELAHHRLWTHEGGRLWTAHRMLRWAAADPEASDAFAASARLEKLHTELYADRYGLWASGDLERSLSAHVKIAVGQLDASGADYLAQSEAALAERAAAAEPPDAPPDEAPLRAALLAAWAREPAAAEARARSLIEGEPPLERLDLLGQERLADVTAWMIDAFLVEPWRGRPLVRAHAARFSPIFAETESVEAAAAALDDADGRVDLLDDIGGAGLAGPDMDGLRRAIAGAHPSVRRYLAYLLLDFATVDPQVEDVLLAAALQFAADFSLSTAFRAVAASELKITKSKLVDLEKNAVDILRRAEIAFGHEQSGDQPSSRGGGRGPSSRFHAAEAIR